MVRLLETTWESATSKIGFDRALATYLNKSKNPQLLDTSWRIARCADNHNLWFCNAPESGWLHGRFWKCRSKLCSYCLANESRRRRKTLQLALESYPASSKRHQWRFVTFTIENPETSISHTREIVNLAWKRFRARACFAPVLAGAKAEEFTLTAKGYHYHLHSLLHFAKRPDYQNWRFNWTECVEASGGQSRRLFGFDTIDGYLIVNFKQITDARNITNELCKYITKSTDFHKLSKATLLELAEQKRWHRMFEFLGALRQKHERLKSSDIPNSSIVHTKRLFAGRNSDLQTFETRRADQRYFAIDFLEQTFGVKLWSYDEMRNVICRKESPE